MLQVRPTNNFLQKPIHRLINQLNVEKEVEENNSNNNVNDESTIKKPLTDTQLWTDKYRPKKFTDLMGDDRLNRQVMSWLKEWDRCVFGKSSMTEHNYKRKRDNNDGHFYRDPFNLNRPQERILLISGPPGLGKTTLAYVIAKHAGYRIFEVNASDDRSAKTVDDKLKSALDVSGITFDGKIDSRPTLILIDEIDGATSESTAGGGFIKQLINITSDYVPKKRNKNGSSIPRLLLRPIICICNDL